MLLCLTVDSFSTNLRVHKLVRRACITIPLIRFLLLGIMKNVCYSAWHTELGVALRSSKHVCWASCIGQLRIPLQLRRLVEIVACFMV